MPSLDLTDGAFYRVRTVQGRTIKISVQFLNDSDGLPIDLTGYTVFGQLRTAAADDSGTILCALSTTPDADNNVVTVDAANGAIYIRIDQVVSDGLAKGTKYPLEVALESAGGDYELGFYGEIVPRYKEVARA